MLNNTLKTAAETSSAVDEGIAMQQRSGSRQAAAFMTAKGIEFAVVVRVLSEPTKRRRTVRTVTFS